ncbi:MAG: formate/nitrite transporter family protein [Ginsengibacter sp.]
MIFSKKEKKTAAEQKPQKSQRIILQQTEEAALTQLERNSTGLILSGISAGLDIGFSVLLMNIILTSFTGIFPDPVIHVLVSNMYPIGFIFVVLGRSELFTEHTTLAILPVLQGLASIKKLLRLWVIVYFSNIFGGIIFALILAYFTGSLHFLQEQSIELIANNLIHNGWLTSLLSAALAGWLMGLLAWLVAASRETISQIVVIWMVTAAIGLAGLPHCIVGNIEVASALFTGKVSFSQYLGFLGPVTLGNAIGGLLFVGILKFSHTVHSGEEKDIDLEEVGKINP